MKKILFLVITIITSCSLYAQNNFEDLQKPLVKEINNNFIIEEYLLITNKLTGDSYQISTKSTSPNNLIHKDYFVMCFTQIYTVMIAGIFVEIESEIENAIKYKYRNRIGIERGNELKLKIAKEIEENIIIETLQKPIGTPDMKIIMTFAEDGLQLSTLVGNERTNETMTWKELLKKN